MPRTAESTFAEALFQPWPAQRAAQSNRGKIAAPRAARTDPFPAVTYWHQRMAGRHLAFSLVAGLLVLSCGSDAFAAIVTEPDILPDGTQYRLVFVTSGTRNAVSSNIADYNAFVQAEANLSPELAALNTTWTAIGSTLAIDARDNTSTNPNTAVGVAIYQLDGDLVANNNADLWDGAISTSISRNQLGGFASDFVWTGTHQTGIVSTYNVVGLEHMFPLGGSPGPFLPPNFAQIGLSGSSSSAQWVSAVRDNINDGNQDLRSMYAISGVLTAGGTAAVPEPASLAIWTLGVLASVIGAYRRQRAALSFPWRADARHLPLAEVA